LRPGRKISVLGQSFHFRANFLLLWVEKNWVKSARLNNTTSKIIQKNKKSLDSQKNGRKSCSYTFIRKKMFTRHKFKIKKNLRISRKNAKLMMLNEFNSEECRNFVAFGAVGAPGQI
jgi:hypothetical protein